MIITLKTLKQQTFKIEVEETESVRTFKEKIEAHNTEFPANCQKLIYAGKILRDETKIGEYDIDEKKFVVVMVTKASQEEIIDKASSSQAAANNTEAIKDPSKKPAQSTSGEGESSPATETKTKAESTGVLPPENEPPLQSSSPVGCILSSNSISIPPGNDDYLPELFKLKMIPNSGSVKFLTADGPYIITAADATDEKMKVWDINSQLCKYSINEHETPIIGIKMSHMAQDNNRVPVLTSVTIDGAISEITIPKGVKFQEVLTYNCITSMDTLGENFLVFGNEIGEVEIYHRDDAKLFRKFPSHQKSIDDLSVSNEKICTVSFPCELKVWEFNYDKFNLIFTLEKSYGIQFKLFDHFYYKCQFFPNIDYLSIFRFTNSVVLADAKQQELHYVDIYKTSHRTILLKGEVTALNATAKFTLVFIRTVENISNLYGFLSYDSTPLFIMKLNFNFTKVVQISLNSYAVAGEVLAILKLDNEGDLIPDLKRKLCNNATVKIGVSHYRILDTNFVDSIGTDGNFIVTSEPVERKVITRFTKEKVWSVWKTKGDKCSRSILNRYEKFAVSMGVIYCTVSTGAIEAIDIASGAEKHRLMTHNLISSIKIFQQFIVTGNFDGSVELFAIDTGELLARKKAHKDAIEVLLVKTKQIVSAVYKNGGEIKVWKWQFNCLILLKCFKDVDFSTITNFASPFLHFAKVNFDEGIIVNDTKRPLLHIFDICTDKKYCEEMDYKVTALDCKDMTLATATFDEEEKHNYIHVYNLIDLNCLYSFQCLGFKFISTLIIFEELKLIVGGSGLAILELQEIDSSTMGYDEIPRDPADGGGAAGEDAPSQNHPAGGQGGERSPTHPGTEGGQQEDTKGPSSKKPRLDNMDDWIASDVALIEDPEVYGNLTQTAKQLTSYTFEVCDSLLNIGPCGKIVMGEPAFLSEEFSGSHDQNLELVTTSGYGKNGALSVLHRSVLPQVVTTFELPGCVDMWTVIGQISESENSEEKVSDMKDKEDSSEETQSKPAPPLKNSHAFLILSRTDSSMILQTGQEINELDNSGFSIQAPTIFAGNMDNNCFIVQVSQMGMRLLQGSAQVQHIPLDVGSPIVWASVADPYLIIMSVEGQVIQLMLKTDDFGGGPRLQVTRPQVKSRVSSLCAYKDISGIFNTKSRQGPEELVTVTNHNAPTLNMADVMQMNHEMSNPWKSMLLNF